MELLLLPPVTDNYTVVTSVKKKNSEGKQSLRTLSKHRRVYPQVERGDHREESLSVIITETVGRRKKITKREGKESDEEMAPGAHMERDFY